MTAKPKLVVTGAHGFVAGSVLCQASNDWETHALSRGAPLTCRDGLSWHVCDPLQTDQLAELIRQVRPKAVIHTAAMADIDLCQAQPDLARAVNVDLTRTLTKVCAYTGARLVFCSTDTVFDGEHAPYREDALPHPVNFYAETKAEAEQLVSALGRQAAVARLSLVVGLPFLGAGNAFLPRMIAALKDGRTVNMPAHEVRTPVDVITVGKALLELAAGEHHGFFHLAGLSSVSRLEMGRTIARRFGYSEDLVMGQSPAPGRAPRPRDVSLDSHSTRARLKTPLRTLDDGLSLILETDAPISL
jgi:dTDP-4-dehydrorhamnose reductase